MNKYNRENNQKHIFVNFFETRPTRKQQRLESKYGKMAASVNEALVMWGPEPASVGHYRWIFTTLIGRGWPCCTSSLRLKGRSTTCSDAVFQLPRGCLSGRAVSNFRCAATKPDNLRWLCCDRAFINTVSSLLASITNAHHHFFKFTWGIKIFIIVVFIPLHPKINIPYTVCNGIGLSYFKVSMVNTLRFLKIHFYCS